MTDPLDNTKFDELRIGDYVKILHLDEWSTKARGSPDNPASESSMVLWVGQKGRIVTIHLSPDVSTGELCYYVKVDNETQNRLGMGSSSYYWRASSLQKLGRKKNGSPRQY